MKTFLIYVLKCDCCRFTHKVFGSAFKSPVMEETLEELNCALLLSIFDKYFLERASSLDKHSFSNEIFSFK